jgi:uncharacterized protein
MKHTIVFCLLVLSLAACTQRVSKSTSPTNNFSIKESYSKVEVMIPMRDGVKLFTAIYVPLDIEGKFPFLVQRTPYSCRPYGQENIPQRLGPSNRYAEDKYIFVYQDVRGRYMSEGNFQEVTPHIANKKSNNDTDESSDTFDTIEWLLKNIKNNNGKVGLYGISYPGFYATASLPGAHPAIKAVSPQAPVTDEFEGDDAYHRGAFFLMDNYDFMNGFDYPRDQPWKKYPQFCTQNITDAYDYFLKMGPIKNANKCFDNKSKIWNEYLLHDTRDAYWQARDIRKHLKNIKPAVLVVGGWYDAEDLFGSLKTYEAIEKQSPKTENYLLMGPWTHGGWARGEWTKYGSMYFGGDVNNYYRQVEYNFFSHYLKGKADFKQAEATVFETGSNQWKQYKTWPPANTTEQTLYLQDNHLLSFAKGNNNGFDEYISDPAAPVPYINTKRGGRDNEYMIADQTFASERKDVVSFTSQSLPRSLSLAGPIKANLFVSTSTTDADFVVKVIEVFADTATENGQKIGGQQRLVRAEILRGKFRNSFEKPEPFTPNNITPLTLVLNDVSHQFRPGSKMMVQVQSSWFPLVDRNPQKFMRIPDAEESDFQKATIRIYHDSKHPSNIQVMVLGK